LTTSAVTPLPDGSNLSAITMDLSGTTQLKSDFKVSNPNMNGSAPSELSGYQISDDGTVSALFEDGSTIPLSRVALANVASPDSLKPLAGNVFSPTLESGALDFSAPQEDGFGTLLSGALEGSNVDIGEELTEMIASQRSYTANSKVFQTGADLLDVLVNLKR
jgi:flagellar hook protein FlgE